MGPGLRFHYYHGGNWTDENILIFFSLVTIIAVFAVVYKERKLRQLTYYWQQGYYFVEIGNDKLQAVHPDNVDLRYGTPRLIIYITNPVETTALNVQ